MYVFVQWYTKLIAEHPTVCVTPEYIWTEKDDSI